MIPQLPFPVIDRQVRRNLDCHFLEQYRYWRVEYEKAHPAPPIENIRFKYDPDWRNSFFLDHLCARGKSLHLASNLGVSHFRRCFWRCHRNDGSDTTFAVRYG